ncbi:MAG: hypothetical protein FJ096_08420 [Deltaproteobacteria bacterium]|nr:hypothetical protein [Deltaproteobacteria bacterium]
MTLDSFNLKGSHYGFSGCRITDLGASEYTLVTIAADASPSIGPFRADIERCIAAIVRACRQSPRADNLMLRVTAFDDRLHEVHGFKPLAECPTAAYDGCLPQGGGTALCDGAANGAQALVDYGKQLRDASFGVNGLLFVITDGEDNSSRRKAPDVKGALDSVIRGETLESLTSVLVGVNVRDPKMASYLADFQAAAGFGRYVELDRADADTLARLADFVGRSVCAQSLALGTGRASLSLSF